MRKIIPVILCLVVVFFAGSYFMINKRNYNFILAGYISGKLTGREEGFDKKIAILRNYVHDNVHPVNGEQSRPDTSFSEKMTSGIGWCDQKARVFIQLAKYAGIKTRLLYLIKEDGVSPHSIAEAWNGSKWVIVDPAFNLDLRNKEGGMASMHDIEKDITILVDNPRVRLFSKKNPIWNEPAFLTVYCRQPQVIDTKKAAGVNWLYIMPSFLREVIVLSAQDIYILKAEKMYRNAPMEYLFFKARNYQLIGRNSQSESCYKEFLTKYDESALADKTRFFYSLLLRDENRPKEAADILEEAVRKNKNPAWIPYFYGLKAELYGIMKDNKAAQDMFKYYAEYPDAYFIK